jgi:O-antigen/teichoic acid export membrane protein
VSDSLLPLEESGVLADPNPPWHRRVRALADPATVGATAIGFWFQAVLVVTGVLSARMLGVEDRGLYALLWLFALSIGSLGTLGIPLAVTFHIARTPGVTRGILRTVRPTLWAQCGSVLVVQAVVLAAFLPGRSAQTVTSGLITLAWPLALIIQQYGLAVLQGQSRFAAFNLLRAAPMTLYLLLIVGIYLGGDGDLVWLTAAIVGSFVAGTVLTVVVTARHLPAETPGDPPGRRTLLRFGLRALFGSVSPVETLQVDQLFVGLVLSPASLGLYVVAAAFTNLPRFVALGIGSVAYPRVAEVADPVLARHRRWRYVLLTVAVCGTLIVLLEALVGRLVPFFFGQSFADAVPVAELLLIGSFFLCTRRVLSDGLRGEDDPAAGSIAEVASWLWALPALVVFERLWGLNGVAIAVSSSYAFGLLVLLALARRPR